VSVSTTLDAVNKATFLNSKNDEGTTALGYAIEQNNIEMVQALLSYSPSLEIDSKNGWTPLFQSIITNNQTIFNLLIDKGADVNKSSPWSAQAEATDIDGVRLFEATDEEIKWFSDNVEEKTKALTAKVTPAHAAAALGRLEMLQKLHEKGVNLLERKQLEGTWSKIPGWNTLDIATLENQVKIVKFLLAKGAQPNEPFGTSKKLPLFYAAQFGKKALYDTLIAGGADILQISDGLNILQKAASNGELEMVKDILQKLAANTTLDYAGKLAFVNATGGDGKKTAWTLADDKHYLDICTEINEWLKSRKAERDQAKVQD
jgi:hypothetical protein